MVLPAGLIPLAVSAAPYAAQYAPHVIKHLPGVFNKGKQLANLLFSSAGRRNVAHMLSTQEGRANILNKVQKYSGHGVNLANTALDLAGKLGVVDKHQLELGQNILNKGHQGFQSALGVLGKFNGAV